ncbi:MAG: hypothetical protein CMN03_02060 [Roseibacillus sp.]|nr:hypothetical protein [Roseibacillus sp.]
MTAGSPSPPKNIVLIGFMGSGKSSIARELSGALGYPMIDTDALIVERAGKPIRDIFAQEGEDAFREMESTVLRELEESLPPHHIIATGGGIIGRSANREILRRMGFVVWLVVSAEEIIKRTENSRERPLLNNNNQMETINRLLDERRELYRATAHQEIETDELTFPEITTGILESARYFFSE